MGLLTEDRDRPRLGGWLLLLCAWLVVWNPLQLAITLAGALGALQTRGPGLGVLIVLRLLVAALGLAAGLVLISHRPMAVPLARAAFVSGAVTDIFALLTPYFPSNRAPGDEPLYIAAVMGYAALWLLYLSRSKRLRAFVS